MRNKLIRTLTCFTGIFTIGSTVAVASTSCGCSNQSIKALPDKVYNIDTSNVLLGFKDDFLNNPDSEIYQDNFKDCDTIAIPNKITTIGNYAFFNNSTLQTTIPEFITKLSFSKNSNCSLIGSNSFNKCIKLQSVDLLNCTKLNTLSSRAFSSCSLLKSILLPSSVTTIGSGAFSSCSSLTSITFPSSLTTIGSATFSGCPSLTSINLSTCVNLTSIGNNAFVWSGLTSITLPTNLSSIGTNVFFNCSNLNEIKWNAWQGPLSAIGNNAFSGVCQDGGDVTVINKIDDAHNSAALLKYLKDNAGLPSSWTAA